MNAVNSPDGRPPVAPRSQGLAGRVMLLVLLAGLFILPFSGAGRRLKEGAIEVIQAAKSPAPPPAVTGPPAPPVTTAPKPEVVVQEKVVYRDPPPPPLPDAFVPRKTVAISEL